MYVHVANQVLDYKNVLVYIKYARVDLKFGSGSENFKNVLYSL